MTMIRKIYYLIIVSLLLLAVAFTQKQIPPEGSTPKDFKLPKKTVFKLDNKLAVTMVQYGKIPKVAINAVIRAGAMNEQDNEQWLSSIVGAMMKEGTKKRSSSKIREDIAMMGGSLNVMVNDDNTVFSCDVLSEKGPDCIELLADVLMNPKLPESELPRLKNDKLRELSVSLADPSAITNEKFMRVLYKDHPYGRGFPTESIINGFTIDKVRKFYQGNFGAQRSHIYVVGQFDERDIEMAIRDKFSDWKSEPPVVTNIPHATSAKDIYITDKPGAAQSTIMMGLPVIDPSNEDYIRLQFVNMLLGGSFASRITSNIREQKGYTYSPWSHISSNFRSAYWAEVASIGTSVTGPAVKEIYYEINRLRSEPPSADELKGIANYMAGTFVLQNSTRTGILNQLAFLDFHGLPDTYLTNYVNSVHAVTPEVVKEVMAKYIRPGEITIVVTGDKRVIEPQLKGYGTIKK
jgi:zinc protease